MWARGSQLGLFSMDNYYAAQKITRASSVIWLFNPVDHFVPAVDAVVWNPLPREGGCWRECMSYWKSFLTHYFAQLNFLQHIPYLLPRMPVIYWRSKSQTMRYRH